MGDNTPSPPINDSVSEQQPFADTCEFNHFDPAVGSVSQSTSDDIGETVRQITARRMQQQSLRETTELTREQELPEDSPKKQPSPPVTWRELVAVLAGIVLVDVTLYHGAGFTGIAAALFGGCMLFWFGFPKPSVSGKMLLLTVLLFVTAVKLVWCGFRNETAAVGFVLLFFIGAIQTGRRLQFIEIPDYFLQTLFGGPPGFADYRKFCAKHSFRLAPGIYSSIGLPLLTVIIFGTIFILANPSLVFWVQQIFDKLLNFFFDISGWFPVWTQILCWFVSAWILTGMIRPFREKFNYFENEFNELGNNFSLKTDSAETSPVKSPYYLGSRNTLFAVIVLFAVYLVFEFKTLWFRDFPHGFCYSDYSHHGAAWLVTALALSTVILSLVFTKKMYQEPRIAVLQRLALIWSLLNFVLAIAVYHRLFLYINFNGMTRMRVVGLLGMTAVLIGFIMVVRKIMTQRNFAWLLSRFTWTVLAMVFLNFVLPVDWLIHRYNVARILNGDYAPAVQISVHPCSNEGYLTFLPLAINCQDEIIRNGIRSLLFQKLVELEQLRQLQLPDKYSGKYSWTKYQIADEILFRQLDVHRNILKTTVPENDVHQSIQRFKNYVYQWY
ncbi:MAG: DUF4173 domain-containing protein [Planctomycetaceae bacterium]|jgi:hypothetical protein|nr:DUF4173 domain-containing protein [Planctomycetaceae bacterium]